MASEKFQKMALEIARSSEQPYLEWGDLADILEQAAIDGARSQFDIIDCEDSSGEYFVVDTAEFPKFIYATFDTRREAEEKLRAYLKEQVSHGK